MQNADYPAGEEDRCVEDAVLGGNFTLPAEGAG
jgi:hypothetical protein